jgi:amidase
MPITDLTAIDLSHQLRAGQLSAREVMAAYLDRIDALNPRHNALVSVADRETLLAEATRKDEALVQANRDGVPVGWMHGMPQAIKDLADAAGFVTTQGSPILCDNVATSDDLMVTRMKAAGCIVIGKTNTPEFGLGSHTFNEVFGVTPNAFDTTKSAGGSSGGAAVALATRLLPVADGSDYGGSLRNPAAWNNVFGFRPSQGRVPTWPSNEVFVSLLATKGPMGRTVTDLAHLLQVQAGFDPRSPMSLPTDTRFDVDLRVRHDATKRSPRIGWLGDLCGYLAFEPGIADVCEEGLARFAGQGYDVEPTDLGYPPEKVWDAWRVWRGCLAGSSVRPYLTDPDQRALVKPEARWEFEEGLRFSARDFMQASARRTAFYQHLPTAQVWPFDATLRWPTTINGIAMDTYHRWMEVAIYATFAGLPCISVPAGFNNAGLPMGMQLIGPPQADLAVLQHAFAYEEASAEVLGRRPT